jgi:heme/copper-type cytochrome/quinol oxidase subunit 3
MSEIIIFVLLLSTFALLSIFYYDQKFNELERKISAIKTVLVIQKIIPPELAKKDLFP